MPAYYLTKHQKVTLDRMQRAAPIRRRNRVITNACPNCHGAVETFVHSLSFSMEKGVRYLSYFVREWRCIMCSSWCNEEYQVMRPGRIKAGIPIEHNQVNIQPRDCRGCGIVFKPEKVAQYYHSRECWLEKDMIRRNLAERRRHENRKLTKSETIQLPVKEFREQLQVDSFKV